jgi:hypothetical protein
MYLVYVIAMDIVLVIVTDTVDEPGGILWTK